MQDSLALNGDALKDTRARAGRQHQLTTMCPNLLKVSWSMSFVMDLSRLPMNRVRVALCWNSSWSDSD